MKINNIKVKNKQLQLILQILLQLQCQLIMKIEMIK